MKLTKLFLTVIILFSILVPAHSGETDCMTLFRQAYEKMRNLYTGKNNAGMAMQYEVEAVLKTNEINHDVVQIKANRTKTKIISQQVMVYQDDKTIVAIQPSSKTIFISRPLPSQARQSQFENVIKLQDSVLRYLTLESCKNVILKKGNPELKMIHFLLAPDKQERLGIAGLTYWIDEKDVRVVKVLIDYTESKPLKSSAFTIESFDEHYHGLPFEGNSINAVFGSNNTLKKEYRGYSVMDKR